jgi:glutamate dehydrogenase (NAD(P)+)
MTALESVPVHGRRPSRSAQPYLQVIWTDPVTGRQGFVVLDRLVRGVASGGLRVRAGCTLDEVRGLAAGMTRKEALHYEPGNRYIPLGGAKGGIDCDPRDPEARPMLARFLDGVRAILERHWTTGEDLGVRQDTIDEVVRELGLRSSIQAIYPLLDDLDEARQRLDRAFAIDVDGIALPELVGGLGVAESALTALDDAGIAYGAARAVVQGFGSMGGATARYLARAGVTVVGLADVHGLIVNPAGLDVEALLAARDEHGAIDRDRLRPADQQRDAADWLGLDCEILVPAAISYCIDTAAAERITARFVVEAANMPTMADAEAELAARGVLVIPDFVANSATNAWWWWTLFGDIDADEHAAEDKVRAAMRTIVTAVLAEANATGTTPRAAAQLVVDDKLRAMDERFTPAEQ